MRATSITVLAGLLELTRASMTRAIDVASFTILSPPNNAQLEKHYGSVPDFSLTERSGRDPAQDRRTDCAGANLTGRDSWL